MRIPAFSPVHDASERAARALTPRRRWGIIVGGAVLGALIGPGGFLLQMRWNTYRATGSDLVTFPGPVEHWGRTLRSMGSVSVVQLFAVCAFVATLALMPFLIRWLESRVSLTRGAYYRAAAAGGVVLGTVATFLVAWMLALAALVAGMWSAASDATAATNAAALLAGALVFGPLVGLFAPFFFVLPIVGVGVPFGLLHGAAIRRLACSPAPATD